MTAILVADSTQSETALTVSTLEGAPVLDLWQHQYDWQLADGHLQVRILASEAQQTLTQEDSEPVASAFARMLQAHPLPDALVMLQAPQQAFPHEKLAFAYGTRLVALQDLEDEAWWDAACLAGILCFGCRDRLRIRVDGRVHAGSVLMALAYGDFCCCSGVLPLAIDESRTGIRWQLPQAGTATVLGAGGFELAQIDGAEGEWRDTGHEGLLRLSLEWPGGRCLTQPRLVRAGGGAG